MSQPSRPGELRLNRISFISIWSARSLASQLIALRRIARRVALGPRKYAFTSRSTASSQAFFWVSQLSHPASSDAQNVADTSKSVTENGPQISSLSHGLSLTPTKLISPYLSDGISIIAVLPNLLSI